MRVFLDPESGTIGAPPAPVALTPEDQAALSANEQPVQVVLPDGSVMMDLKGTCQEYVVMQLDASGRMNLHCVQDPKTAAANPAPASQPPDR